MEKRQNEPGTLSDLSVPRQAASTDAARKGRILPTGFLLKKLPARPIANPIAALG
jgi:hypothetical protein